MTPKEVIEKYRLFDTDLMHLFVDDEPESLSAQVVELYDALVAQTAALEAAEVVIKGLEGQTHICLQDRCGVSGWEG